jgi:hypothetical protein
MKKKIQKERTLAVQRYFAGEDPESICASFGKQKAGCTNGYHAILLMIPLGLKISLGDRFPVLTAPLRRSK